MLNIYSIIINNKKTKKTEFHAVINEGLFYTLYPHTINPKKQKQKKFRLDNCLTVFYNVKHFFNNYQKKKEKKNGISRRDSWRTSLHIIPALYPHTINQLLYHFIVV